MPKLDLRAFEDRVFIDFLFKKTIKNIDIKLADILQNYFISQTEAYRLT